MGLVVTYKDHLDSLHPEAYVCVTTGFCGSLTTFSGWQISIASRWFEDQTSGRSSLYAAVSDTVFSIWIGIGAYVAGRYAFRSTRYQEFLQVRNIRERLRREQERERLAHVEERLRQSEERLLSGYLDDLDVLATTEQHGSHLGSQYEPEGNKMLDKEFLDKEFLVISSHPEYSTGHNLVTSTSVQGIMRLRAPSSPAPASSHCLPDSPASNPVAQARSAYSVSCTNHPVVVVDHPKSLPYEPAPGSELVTSRAPHNKRWRTLPESRGGAEIHDKEYREKPSAPDHFDDEYPVNLLPRLPQWAFWAICTVEILAPLLICMLCSPAQYMAAIPLGILGTFSRLGLSTLLNKPGKLPWGTFAANVAGTLIYSVAFVAKSGLPEGSTKPLGGLDHASWALRSTWLSAVTGGFCGCLTTLSTFVTEICNHANTLRWPYIIVSVLAAQIVSLVTLAVHSALT